MATGIQMFDSLLSEEAQIETLKAIDVSQFNEILGYLAYDQSDKDYCT